MPQNCYFFQENNKNKEQKKAKILGYRSLSLRFNRIYNCLILILLSFRPFLMFVF